MRRVGPRVAAASATCLALFGLSIHAAHGDRIVETVYAEPVTYYAPTSYVTTSYAPTSYVTTSYAPTSYVATSRVIPTTYAYSVPTSYSYAVPTSYSYAVPTSYSYAVPTGYSYVPTTYATSPTYTTTTYYRRGLLSRLFSRPVIETTATYAYDTTPTTFYQPTAISLVPTLPAAVATTACVESPVPFSPPPSYGGNGTSPSSKTVTSQPKAAEEPKYQAPAPSNPPAGPAAKDDLSAPIDPPANPPNSPVVDPKDLDPPPVSPPPGGDTQSRSSFRPAATVMTPRVGGSSQNLLRGSVVSGLTDKGTPGRQVIFSDMTGTYPPKKRTTDANGGFEVYLPNGSWSVSVLDPTAAAGTKPVEYPDPITVTGGRYVDESGNPIYSLRLSN